MAGVGEGRRCSVTEDIRRGPQQETGGRPLVHCAQQEIATSVCELARNNKKKPPTFVGGFCVRVTYLPRQSPAKYCQRT